DSAQRAPCRAGGGAAPSRRAAPARARTSGFPDQARQRPAPAGDKRSFAPRGPCSELLAGFVRRSRASVAEARQAQASAKEQSRPRSRPGLATAPHGYGLGTPAATPAALPATIRYTRSPSVSSDSSLSPSFLRTTAARKARTVCGCQPVERVTVATVAPLGPHSSASTRACFEFARPLG